MSEVKVNKISPRSGTDVQLGDSGDTITIPAGATFDSSAATNTLPANVVTTDGSQTLTNKTIDASQLTGTVATSNLGTGTADSTTFLRGDQTFASATPADNSITTAQLAYNPNPFRNIIINGDMSIAQRGTSFTGINSGNSTYPVDRFRANLGATPGTWTISQDTTVPTGQGFAKSVKYDCTTANGSLAAGAFLLFEQQFEGQNLQYLKKGTSSAESTTLSFWVKSNKTGTYICELLDADNSRAISKSYTINVADTWEKKTITYAGDTSGAFDNDNAASLRLFFWLAAGSTYSSGSLQTSWGTRVDANAAAGQVNLADSTSNEWYVTGVQLEAGTTASEFEFLPVDVNLRRCQRYFQSWGDFMILVLYGQLADTGGLRAGQINYVGGIMRASPTHSWTDTSSNANKFTITKANGSGTTNINLRPFSWNQNQIQYLATYNEPTGLTSQGDMGWGNALSWTANAEL